MKALSKPQLLPWEPTAEDRAKVDELQKTSQWLKAKKDDDDLQRYRGMWIAARNCKIVAAADSLDQLSAKLNHESIKGYVIACLRGGRIRVKAE